MLQKTASPGSLKRVYLEHVLQKVDENGTLIEPPQTEVFALFAHQLTQLVLVAQLLVHCLQDLGCDSGLAGEETGLHGALVGLRDHSSLVSHIDWKADHDLEQDDPERPDVKGMRALHQVGELIWVVALTEC